jgi:hypothetical protein
VHVFFWPDLTYFNARLRRGGTVRDLRPIKYVLFFLALFGGLFWFGQMALAS